MNVHRNNPRNNLNESVETTWEVSCYLAKEGLIQK